jgi:predicted Zn-dependent peptidase
VLERAGDGSTVTASLLPGGLRVVTESVPGARSATIGVWVGVGSVDETPRLAGASHYLEHLLFKGTRTRTGYEIADAVDAVGGELNAFTSHEYTCYYARILADQAHLAVDLVCDVVLDAVISAGDVDTERTVILEEIAMRDDDPEDTLADAFAAAVFAGHPVAAPVIGSAGTITAMSRTQIAGYYRRRYSPPKMVVAIAGGVDHADALRWVRSAFAARLATDPEATPAGHRIGRGRPRPVRHPLVVPRDTEQAHLTVGMPSGDRNSPDRFVLAVLSAALGGGMSSRLFRSIREERGLAYSCYSATACYSDVGSLSIYAGFAPVHLGQVAKLI